MTEIELNQIRLYSNSELHSTTCALAHRERTLSTVILHHLKEIDRRRAWAELAYSSLVEYCVKSLHYSETQACRRVAAVRLMQEMPEIESKIIEGKLNLTTLGQAQSFFRHEAKAKNQRVSTQTKQAILEKIEGKTQRQVEVELATLSPTFARPDRTQPISATEVTIQFTASTQLMQKIQRLRELLANSVGIDASYDQLFTHVCEIALTRVDPERRPNRRAGTRGDLKPQTPKDEGSIEAESGAACRPAGRAAGGAQTSETGAHLPKSRARSTDAVENKIASGAEGGAVDLGSVTQSSTVGLSNALECGASSRPRAAALENNPASNARESCVKPITPLRRPIAAALKRAVWRRDGGQCTYRDSKSGRRCGCRSGLQYDHIQPVALGGGNEFENLRLYCQAHNLFAGRQTFGEQPRASRTS